MEVWLSPAPTAFTTGHAFIGSGSKPISWVPNRDVAQFCIAPVLPSVCQGHSSPGFYARVFLEGRVDEERIRLIAADTDRLLLKRMGGMRRRRVPGLQEQERRLHTRTLLRQIR
jgi:MOSC domain-containing protein YiiM